MRQEKAYKIKLVKILEILRQDSDEDNYIESTEILSKLAATWGFGSKTTRDVKKRVVALP